MRQLSQRGHADFAAHVGGDRVQQFRAAHESIIPDENNSQDGILVCYCAN